MKTLKPVLILLSLLTVLTGIIYPVVVLISAQLLFPEQANGSLLYDKHQVIGSALIGQSFTRPEYFWGRPSVTSPAAYDASASSGSNLGPTNPVLLDAIQARIKTLRDPDSRQDNLVPIDLVTASASGLDPHISPAAALFQVDRIAAARHLPVDELHALVARFTEPRQWFVLGEPRVNVLKLNLALDGRLVKQK